MITATALRLLELLATVLPEGWLYRLARWAGALALPVAERRRLIVRANIQRLQPSWGPDRLDTAIRRVFQETACYYVDAVLLPRRTPREILDSRITVDGLELLEEALAVGKGVVLAGAHLSNPEVPFRALAALHIEAMALVQPLRSQHRMDAMQRLRSTSGVRFVPANMTGVRQAIEALSRGEVVAVLADRDIQGNGVCVPFAGRQARFPTGAVDLAMRTDAPLIVGLANRLDNDRFRVTFLPVEPLLHSDNRVHDLRANVASLVRCLEPAIAADCEQWRVFESPWKPCRDTGYLDPRGGARPRELPGARRHD